MDVENMCALLGLGFFDYMIRLTKKNAISLS